MGSIVQRITIIDKDSNGNIRTETLYKKNSGRKESGWARPLIKAQRRSLKASQVYVNELLSRNERSGQKKKDGWLKDMGANNMKAARKAYRKLS